MRHALAERNGDCDSDDANDSDDDDSDDAKVNGSVWNRESRLALAIVLVAILIFWASALYGISSPFYYGHYGYHGGSYATWARGTLRYHTLLPVNETGFSGPSPGSYYIHHPILTHQLVTVTFWLFGEHEWSVRLAALIPSFASLLLVSTIAWRHLSPLGGALAAVVFAIVPVNVWYAVNIDQGFPSIACLLAFFWFYLLWLRSGRWSHAVWALCFQCLAGGFEWSPYFAYPVIFAHVAHTALRRRGRFLVFALLHPLVVLLPIAGHVVAVWRADMLDDLLAAYRNRAAPMTYSHFLDDMGNYGATLFGRVLLVVMFVWLLMSLADLVRGRGRAVNLVGLTFALALILYIHVFKVAVGTHAYRQLYGNVWAAFAAADLADRVRRLVSRSWSRSLWSWSSSSSGLGPKKRALWPRQYVAYAAVVALPAAIVLGTVPLSWAGLKESRAHGGIPGWTQFNPDLRQTAFANQVRLLSTPADKVYVHPGYPPTPPSRMDWAFYYDRDLIRGMSLARAQQLPAAQKANALLVLSVANLGPDELRAYAELSLRYAVVRIVDLALVDLRQPVIGGKKHVFALAPTADRSSSSAWRRWLAGPYPWPQLVTDPQAEAAERRRLSDALAAGAQPTTTAPSLGPKLKPPTPRDKIRHDIPGP